jgi:threonine dehydratase
MQSVPIQQTQLPTLAGIQDALCNIRQFFPESSPLVRSEVLSQVFNADVWLKNETTSPIASFKFRGALNAIMQAQAKGLVTGVTTSSSGNHGQGVAYAARLLGLPADIFLPENPNPVKRQMIAAFGAKIHEGGHDIDAAKERSQIFAAQHELAFIDDGDNLDLIEGAGTVGLEIAQSLTDIDAVLIPMGSGSLASGCAAALKGLQPNIKVIAVQSDASPAMVESFYAKQPVERPIHTLADGIVCRVPAMVALSSLWHYLDDAWLVSDEQLLAAVHTFIESAHLLVEPSGAAALAALWQNKQLFEKKRVVLVLTGANITMPLLMQALETEPLFWFNALS